MALEGPGGPPWNEASVWSLCSFQQAEGNFMEETWPTGDTEFTFLQICPDPPGRRAGASELILVDSCEEPEGTLASLCGLRGAAAPAAEA